MELCHKIDFRRSNYVFLKHTHMYIVRALPTFVGAFFFQICQNTYAICLNKKFPVCMGCEC